MPRPAPRLAPLTRATLPARGRAGPLTGAETSRTPRRASLRFLDRELLDLLVEIAALEANHLGGLGDVPVVLGELRREIGALEILLRLAVGRPERHEASTAGAFAARRGAP